MRHAVALALAACTALAGGDFAAHAPVAAAHSTDVRHDAPTGLRVEGRGELLGTDVARPRLSWLAPAAPGGGQSHYQIQVARSESDLLHGTLLWDSGKVASAQRNQIVYGGPALASRSRYVWRVRSFQTTGAASAWSEAGHWEMGLLSPADWKARWIGAGQPMANDWDDAVTEWRFTPTGGPVDFLFRASPVGKTYGEAYAWRLDVVGGRARINALSRHYDGSAQAVVRERVLKSIDLGIAWQQLAGRPHVLRVEARGRSIVTLFDGVVVDRLSDDAHRTGTAGVYQQGWNPATGQTPPGAFILHAIRVTPAAGPAVVADFAEGYNPLSGGTIEPDGLHPANAKGLDIVFTQGAPAPLLRKEFRVERDIASARLYVAAGGFPRLEINGTQINDAIADGFTAYDRRVLYRTFDVTHAIGKGRNVVGAELGRGWYDLAEPNEWYWHNPPWRGRPALRLQLEIRFTDGTSQIVASDDGWQTRAGPTLHDSIYAGERYDARLFPAGWSKPGFDAKTWRAAEIVRGPSGELDAAEQQPIAVAQIVRPVSMTQVRPGVWVYDFGRIFAGRPRLKARGPRGHTITLIQHEKLRPDGTVQALSTHVDAQLQTDQYRFAGSGVEEWAPQFGYRGFRYVEMHGFPGKPTLDTLSGEVMHSDVASVGTFAASNPLLNQIQDAARATILNNMHGFQTDTPTFEKNGWTGDAQASALAAALNFDVAPVWTKWLRDFEDAQAPSGEIPEIVPSTPFYGYERTPGWSMVEGPTPSWDAALFVLPEELHSLTGDVRVLAEHYAAQKKLVDYSASWFTPDDFRYLRASNTDLGEYAFPRPPVPGASEATAQDVGAVSTAYLFYMTDRLARNAALLGKTSDARLYAERAARIRAAYNRRYWDSERRYYRIPSEPRNEARFVQYHNVLPVAFGLVPEGEAEAVIQKVADDIAAHGYHLSSMGVYSGRHALTLLSDFGHVDTVYKLVSQTRAPSWGYWLSQGVNTMLETWDLSSRSYDHHYWASVSSWFYQGLGGIRPATPGYGRIVVRPAVPRDLDHVSVELDTVQGRVSSAWRQSRDGILLEIEVPAGTEAEVWCPTAALAFPPLARRLPDADGHQRFAVPGGRHRFTCRSQRGEDR